MIDEIKDELKVILKDLETVNETSDINKIMSNFQELYKKMILFQFNKEGQKVIGKEEQKEVNKAADITDELVTEISYQENTDNFEDLFSSVANPEFITKEENKNQISLESKKLNESLIKGINIGLNDKIAFTKNLFDGNEEDYSRVISQIQTYTSWDEAYNFLNNIVKPDYNNWEGKEQIEKRFLKCIESNF